MWLGFWGPKCTCNLPQGSSSRNEWCVQDLPGDHKGPVVREIGIKEADLGKMSGDACVVSGKRVKPHMLSYIEENISDSLRVGKTCIEKFGGNSF